MFSLSCLDQLGFTFKAQKGKLTVFKGSLAVMKGVRSNGLYKLAGVSFIASACAIGKEQITSMLWHLRLAHISDKGMEELHKQGLLDDTAVSWKANLLLVAALSSTEAEYIAVT